LKFSIATVALPDFPHTAAFAEPAEALLHGLRELGHDVQLSGAQLCADRHNLLFGSHLLPAQAVLYPQTILVNLEQLEANPYLSRHYLERLRRHTVWDYSTSNVRYLHGLGANQVFHVPMGFVPQLTRISRRQADIDVLFYGVINARRDLILNQLVRAGVRALYLGNAYGAERDACIARSRIVLNMHFHQGRILELARVLYLLANGIFVVSESVSDKEEMQRFSGGLVFADYGRLAQTCLRYLGDDPARESVALRGREAALALPQAAYLAPVLQAMRACGRLPAT